MDFAFKTFQEKATEGAGQVLRGWEPVPEAEAAGLQGEEVGIQREEAVGGGFG